MDFRFVQKRDYTHIFYIERKINLFTKHFWVPFYKPKQFITWYLIGVGLQLLFGLLFGLIYYFSESKAITYVVTSNMYFICSWIFPIINTLFTTKYTVNLIEFDDKFYININVPRIFSAFCQKNSEFILIKEGERVIIDKPNMFLVNKKTFWGRTKKVYHIGIKQLRKEKLEHLFS